MIVQFDRSIQTAVGATDFVHCARLWPVNTFPELSVVVTNCSQSLLGSLDVNKGFAIWK